MNEIELFDQVVAYIQANYSEFLANDYFIKIQEVSEEDQSSQIVWCKTLNSYKEVMDFYHESDVHRTCILVNSNGYKYLVRGFGAFSGITYEFCRDKMFKMPGESYRNREDHKIDHELRELAEKAFGELKEDLAALKKPMAV